MLFRLYAELGNLRLVEVEAKRRGLRPKTLVLLTVASGAALPLHAAGCITS